VIDPNARWMAGPFQSRSQNSPWKNTELTGRPVATIHRGRITHDVARQEVRS
jgi:dihydroorotase-like cyclic amidohydrolase